MKNLLVITILFCIYFCHGQELTKKTLQGTWNLSYYTDSTGAKFDILNSTYSPGPNLSEKDLEGLQSYWEEELEYHKETSLRFEGKKLFYNRGGTSFFSAFKLKNINGDIYLLYKNSEDEKMSYKIFIKNNQLHLIYSLEKNSYEFIFIPN